MALNTLKDATAPAPPASRRRRLPHGINKKSPDYDPTSRGKAVNIPEYLEHHQINAIMAAAPHPQARLLMLIQWRAGLRVSEALALHRADLSLDVQRPTLTVRRGKGGKGRVVPVHPELHQALNLVIDYADLDDRDPLVDCSIRTAHRWVKSAVISAKRNNALPQRKDVTSHTFRHSCARHWLEHQVKINKVSRWLGHASIETTLIYLQLIPDPPGDLDSVP